MLTQRDLVLHPFQLRARIKARAEYIRSLRREERHLLKKSCAVKAPKAQEILNARARFVRSMAQTASVSQRTDLLVGALIKGRVYRDIEKKNMTAPNVDSMADVLKILSICYSDGVKGVLNFLTAREEVLNWLEGTVVRPSDVGKTE